LREAAGVPVVATFLPGSWQERELTHDVLREAGVRVLALGVQPFAAALAAMRSAYQQIKSGAPFASVAPEGMSTEEFARIIGLYEVIEIGRKYMPVVEAAMGT
jgi:2-methylisocitrate lyase-like PEP mutase family enzyme